MKKTILLAFCSILSFMVFGQATTANQKYLKPDAKPCELRHSFYLKSFTNGGGIEVSGIEQQVKDYLKTKPQENKLWYQQPFYVLTENEADAQVIISATYFMKNTVTEETKKVYKKEMPYAVYFKEHTSAAEVIAKFEYTDGTPTKIDTIEIEHVSKELPWKSFSTVAEIEEKTKQSLAYAIKKEKVDAENKEVRIIFPKVKIKDKALKEEYDNLQSLLKNNQFIEAGQLCKKVYESAKSPEASAALGLCYELVGNYPKAEELIKPLKDFHMISRMRKNMKLLEFARSIGYEPEFIDF